MSYHILSKELSNPELKDILQALNTFFQSKEIDFGLMDKIQAKKLHKPLFYLPLQAFEKMNKKSAFTVVVK